MERSKPIPTINAFESKEEQTEVALLFSTSIGQVTDNNGNTEDFMDLTSAEKETYLNQLVKKIKSYSIEEKMRNSIDMKVFSYACCILRLFPPGLLMKHSIYRQRKPKYKL